MFYRRCHVGFTSVMLDRSSAPFEENVRETAEVVRAAHAVGAAVEAELGHVGFGRDYGVSDADTLTRPEDVAEFVKRTDVDCLAVAVGTAHGHYAGTPHIDFERLDAIRQITDIPLCSTGAPPPGTKTCARRSSMASARSISAPTWGTRASAP